MRLGDMEKRSTSTPTGAFWSLPSDFIELRHVQATTSGGSKVLEYITPGLADKQRRRLSGEYAFYTLVDNAIEIIPHPTSESTTEIEIFYYAKVDALTDSTDTNDVVTNYPNLYLYAMMGEAALYREAGDRARQWFDSFDAYARQLNEQAQSARYSGDYLSMRAV